MRHTMKRTLALFLAAVMCFSTVSTGVFAEEPVTDMGENPLAISEVTDTPVRTDDKGTAEQEDGSVEEAAAKTEDSNGVSNSTDAPQGIVTLSEDDLNPKEELPAEGEKDTTAVEYIAEAVGVTAVTLKVNDELDLMNGVTVSVKDGEGNDAPEDIKAQYRIRVAEVKRSLNGEPDEEYRFDPNAGSGIKPDKGGYTYFVKYVVEKLEEEVWTEVDSSDREVYSDNTYEFDVEGIDDCSVNTNTEFNLFEAVELKISPLGGEGEIEDGDHYRLAVTSVTRTHNGEEDSTYVYDPSATSFKTPDDGGYVYKINYQVQHQRFTAEGSEWTAVKKDNGENLDYPRQITVITEVIVKDTLDTCDEFISKALIENTSTGTEPFDDTDDPGCDSGPDNDVVRTFDTVTYTLQMVSDGYSSGVFYKSGYVWYKFVLPCSESEAVFDTSSMGWISINPGYESYQTTETIDGKECQVLYAAAYVSPMEGQENALPISNMTKNFAIKVLAMNNGAEFTPKAYIWMDHSLGYASNPKNWTEEQRQSLGADTVCEEHKDNAKTNGKEVREYTFRPVKISAAPSYDVELRVARVDYQIDTYDFNTGIEGTSPDYGYGEVYGQSNRFGFTLTLRNSDPAKGLKGIELPAGDITFDAVIKVTYTTTDGTVHDISEEYTPLLWSAGQNRSLGAKSAPMPDGREKINTDTYPVSAGPFNSAGYNEKRNYGNYCWNGGNWTFNRDGATLHITVSDYEINPSFFPAALNSTTLDGRQKGEYYGPLNEEGLSKTYIGAFSSGYIEVVQPFGAKGTEEYLVNKYGSGTIQFTIKDINLKATSSSGVAFRDTDGTNDRQVNTGNDSKTGTFYLAKPGTFENIVNYNNGTNVQHTDFNNVAWNMNGTKYQNGQDVGQVGQSGGIAWGGVSGKDGIEENLMTGMNSLLKFDPTLIEITGTPKASTSYAETGFTATFLYAAKKDGTAWISFDEMDTAVEEDLVYYSSLSELEGAGKVCVGILQEGRSDSPSGTESHRMMVSYVPVRIIEDYSNAGKVAATCVSANVWKKGTVEKGSMLPSRIDVQNNSEVTFPTPTHETVRKHYVPAEYDENGVYTGGHTGARNIGDSLYIVPYKTQIIKYVNQLAAEGSASRKDNFLLDNEQTIVDFEIQAKTINVVEDVPEDFNNKTTVYLVDILPEGVSYIAGSAVFGGTYSQSSPNLGYQGTVTGGTQIEPAEITVYGTLTTNGFTPAVKNEAGEYVLSKTDAAYSALLWTISDVTIGDALSNLNYSVLIDKLAAKNNDQYRNCCYIYTEQIQSKDYTINAETFSQAGFKVTKNAAMAMIKAPDEVYNDSGDSIGFTLSWQNTSENAIRNTVMMDTMPSDGNNGSRYHGTWSMTGEPNGTGTAAITVKAPSGCNAQDYEFWYTTDAGASTKVAADYTADGIRAAGSGWTKVDVAADATVTIPEADRSAVTAWCLIGSIPGGATVSAHMTILTEDSKPGDSFCNTISGGNGNNRATAYIADRKISGTTWVDSDKDGRLDGNEKRLSGVKVSLYKVNEAGQPFENVYNNLDGTACTMQTDGNGFYSFEHLEAGNYLVRFESGSTTLEGTYFLTKPYASGVDNKVNSKAKVTEYGVNSTVAIAEIPGDEGGAWITMPPAKEIKSSPYQVMYQNAGFYTSEPASVHVKPELQKKLMENETEISSTIAAGQFTFTLEDLNTSGAGTKYELPEDRTAATQKGGKVVFEELTFNKAGVYTFKITEDTKDDNNYIQDGGYILVTVTVTEHDNPDTTVIGEPKIFKTDVVYTYYDKSGNKVTGRSNTMINEHEVIEIPVSKVWEDNDNAKSKRPNVITVRLSGKVGDSEVVSSDTNYKEVIPDRNGNWSCTFTGLEKYYNNQEIVYSVSEDEVPNYVAAITGNTTDGFTITNTLRGDLVIRKEFAADSQISTTTDPAKIPSKLSFTVTGPNKFNKTVKYSEFTNGSYTFEYVDAGKYTVVEENSEVPGYTITTTYMVGTTETGTAKVTNGNTAEIKVVNDYRKSEATLVLTGTKAVVMADGEVRSSLTANEFTFTLSAAGDTAASADLILPTTKTVGNDAEGKFTFDAIKFTAAGTYELQVTETEGDGDYEYDSAPSVITVVVEAVGSKLQIKTVNGTAYNLENATAPLTEKAEGKATASFINKELKGKLVLRKEFAADSQISTTTDADKIPAELSFKVTGPNGFEQTVKYSDFRDKPYEFQNLVPGEYTVEEVNAAVDGYTLEVAYEVNGEDAQTGTSATVDVTAGAAAEAKVVFTNDYTPSTTQFQLTATKVFVDYAGNRAESIPEFSFKASCTAAPTGAAKPDDVTAKNGSDGKITFPEISVNRAGEYTFTVTEIKGDNTDYNYDEKTYEVVVTIEPDGSELNVVRVVVGEEFLTADGIKYELPKQEKEYEKTDLSKAKYNASFINDEKYGQLTLKKTISGADKIKEIPDFEFTVTGPQNYSKTVLYSDMTRGSITLNHLPIGEYTISEDPESAAAAGYTVDVTYKVNGEDAQTGTSAKVDVTADATAKAEVVFNNGYTPGTTKFQFTGTKAFIDYTGTVATTVPEFDFTLTCTAAPDENNKPAAQEKKNTANGSITFDEIEVNEAGTYKFTIAEKAGTDATITYDTAEYQVEVEVVAEGTELKVNSVKANSEEITGSGVYALPEKTVTDPDGATATASFVNTEKYGSLDVTKNFGADSDITAADADQVKNLTFTVEGPETFGTSGKDTFTYAQMTNGVKEYPRVPLGRYTVTESNADIPGYNRTTVYTVQYGEVKAEETLSLKVKNTYKAVFAQPEIQKQVVDNTTAKDLTEEQLKEKTFTFTIEGMDDASKATLPKDYVNTIEAKHGETGTFAKIYYTENGTYTYKVTETVETPNPEGFMYSTSAVTVTVVVSGDTNHQTAEASYAGGEGSNKNTFVNAYVDTEKEIKLEKTISGDTTDLTVANMAGKFKFTLTAVETGNPMPEKTEATHAADGSVEFGKMTFKKAGTYNYTIEENQLNTSWTKMATLYVRVTVTEDNENHKLLSKLEYSTDGTNFVEKDKDTYSVDNLREDPKGEAELSITKVVDPLKAIDAETLPNIDELKKLFTFKVTADAKTTIIRDSGLEAQIDTPMPEVTEAQNEDGGTVDFGMIKYTAAGTYVYTIKETANVFTAPDAEIYSSTVEITATVTATLSTEKNELIVSVEYTPGADAIVNKYEHSLPVDVDLAVLKLIDDQTADGSAPTVAEMAGKFSFTLIPGENTSLEASKRHKVDTPMPSADTVANDAAGLAAFGTITFTEPGDYNYTIHENKAPNGYWKNGADVAVMVHVEKGENNQLVATVYYDGVEATDKSMTAKITNTYDNVELVVLKYWADLEDQCKERPESVFCKLYADGICLDENGFYLTKAGGWYKTFKNLPKFNDDGTEIVYSVNERAIKNYGTWYRVDKIEGVHGYQIQVINTHKIVTRTGDDSSFMLWALSGLLSLGGAMGIGRFRKKKKNGMA